VENPVLYYLTGFLGAISLNLRGKKVSIFLFKEQFLALAREEFVFEKAPTFF